MDEIIESFVRAGYYRARISSLSDFDKIIGGMAWAMQLFSCDINIDVFYADTLDLGQKIGLTERLVMVLIALKCPYRLEPHQIVGLDYTNMLPAIKWLLKRSEEVRREHAAFNRLLALRHYHRVTNTQQGNSKWRHVVSLAHLGTACEKDMRADGKLNQLTRTCEDIDDQAARGRTDELLANISEQFKDNKRVSFVKLATALRISNKLLGGRSANFAPDLAQNQQQQPQTAQAEVDNEEEDDDDEDEDSVQQAKESGAVGAVDRLAVESTCFTDDDAKTTVSNGEASPAGKMMMSHEELEEHRKLDHELLATNQKILNLLKKLDLMPSKLEICQYQRRYIELHQQLISKNKDVKKLFDLYNSLDVEKHYLERELSLLDSIGDNLHLTNNSVDNRGQFMRQLEVIIAKIRSIRDDMESRVVTLRRKCDVMNEEYLKLMMAID